MAKAHEYSTSAKCIPSRILLSLTSSGIAALHNVADCAGGSKHSIRLANHANIVILGLAGNTVIDLRQSHLPTFSQPSSDSLPQAL
jgi:hypothetical protein